MRISDTFPGPPSSPLEVLRGHARTLVPFVARRLRPPLRPPSEPFEVELEDPVRGPIRLSGRHYDAGGRELVIVVHGLGGSVDSDYMALALAAAARAGQSCLLLNTRGADRSGQGLAHAGLVADLEAALGSELGRRYELIDLFGYSLGGQLVLRYAVGEVDPRVRRVAAIGAPLLLSRSADAFDAPRLSVYRRHVLESLYQIYTAVYQRAPGGLSPEEARTIRRIREWDERIIAPHFGFADAEAYYQSASAGPRLSELAVDALYVGAPSDPMVPPSAVQPALEALGEPGRGRLTVLWDRAAGHLGFPPGFDLGQAAPLGLEDQVLGWLRRAP